MWVGGIVLALGVLIGLVWLMKGDDTMTDTAATPQVATTTTGVASGALVPKVTKGSVAAILSGLPDTSRFAAELSTTGVAGSITGKGPYTLFVPINEAYAHLPAGTIEKLTSTQLKRLVSYHVVSGKAIDVSVQTSGTVQALSKDPLNFSVRMGDKTARINSSVALQSFKADNGVVYLIDQVLLPPTPSTY